MPIAASEVEERTEFVVWSLRTDEGEITLKSCPGKDWVEVSGFDGSRPFHLGTISLDRADLEVSQIRTKADMATVANAVEDSINSTGYIRDFPGYTGDELE